MDDAVARRMTAVLMLGAVPGLRGEAAGRVLDRVRQMDRIGGLATADVDHLMALTGLARHQADIMARSRERLRHRTDSLLASGLRVLLDGDADWPLRGAIGGRRPWLFLRGDSSALGGRAIGFSGSREVDEVALRSTHALAQSCADSGVTVVSGGARGVDTAAHIGAVDAGGKTIIVLPQGHETWRAYDPLARRLDAAGVLCLSEFLPDDGWANEGALQRNATILDLADALIVPAAGTTGGAIRTGRLALRSGFPTWVAQRNEDRLGNGALIRAGGKPFGSDDPAGTIKQITLALAAPAVTQGSLF